MENKNQDIIQQLHKVLGQASSPEFLFEQWQEELVLRQSLRHVSIDDCLLPLENAEDFAFYKRTFYDVGMKNTFFSVVMNHLSQPFLPEILSSQSSDFVHDFFIALQQHFISHFPTIGELKALIGLFLPEYQDFYRTLCANLTEKDLKYLLEKTSNATLRSLVLSALEKNQQKSLQNTDWLLFSEVQKLSLAKETAQRLEQKIAHWEKNETWFPEYFSPLLKAGKLKDMMEILELLRKLADPKIFLPLRALLHTTIPLHALLYHPENAYNYARQQYKQFFPEEKNSPITFHYLHLYQLAVRCQSFPMLPFRREFSLRIRQILKQRPDDVIGEWFKADFLHTTEEPIARKIFTEAQNRLENAPHETAALLEVLYVILANQKALYSPQFLDDLLTYAWRLCRWTHSFFVLPSADVFSAFSSLAGTKIFSQVQHSILPQKQEEFS